MKLNSKFIIIALMVFVSACVTINVYFPAAEAEDAAAEIVNEILGSEDEVEVKNENPQSRNFNPLSFLISSAQAQVNININSPSIQEITTRMKQRYEQDMIGYLNKKVVGFTNQGFMELLDPKSVSLKERQSLKKLVADENRDRKALYRELAVANGHPEWEEDIQNVFVKQWINQARAGWMYQNSTSAWVTK